MCKTRLLNPFLGHDSRGFLLNLPTFFHWIKLCRQIICGKAYVQGINWYAGRCAKSKRLPLEFTLTQQPWEEWTVAQSLSLVRFWGFAMNFGFQSFGAFFRDIWRVQHDIMGYYVCLCNVITCT